jgi:hypothetical protein
LASAESILSFQQHRTRVAKRKEGEEEEEEEEEEEPERAALPDTG